MSIHTIGVSHSISGFSCKFNIYKHHQRLFIEFNIITYYKYRMPDDLENQDSMIRGGGFIKLPQFGESLVKTVLSNTLLPKVSIDTLDNLIPKVLPKVSIDTLGIKLPNANQQTIHSESNSNENQNRKIESNTPFIQKTELEEPHMQNSLPQNMNLSSEKSILPKATQPTINSESNSKEYQKKKIEPELNDNSNSNTVQTSTIPVKPQTIPIAMEQVNIKYKTLTFAFQKIYLIFTIILIILISTLIISIVILPILFAFDHDLDNKYEDLTSNNGEPFPFQVLSKYHISRYIWCKYDKDYFSDINKYKYYTPTIIINSIINIIAILVILIFFHLILLIFIIVNSGNSNSTNILTTILPQELINNFILFVAIILIIGILWLCMYITFSMTILNAIEKTRKHNNNINDKINTIIHESNLFTNKHELEKLLKDVLTSEDSQDFNNIMKKYYKNKQNEIEDFDSSDKSKSKINYGILFLILYYFHNKNKSYKNQNSKKFSKSDFVYNITQYFISPFESRHSFVGFTCDNYVTSQSSYSSHPSLLILLGLNDDEITKMQINISELNANIQDSNESMNYGKNQTLYYTIYMFLIAIIISIIIIIAVKLNINNFLGLFSM